jgi:type IV secretory pathway component VirB8
MEQKKFEKGSKFEKYDLDGDEEMSQAEKLHEIEQEDLKAKAEVRKMAAQRRMAWIALASMLIFTVILMFPIIPDTRVKLLGDLSSLFYVAMAGVVGAYMGMTAYMSRK